MPLLINAPNAAHLLRCDTGWSQNSANFAARPCIQAHGGFLEVAFNCDNLHRSIIMPGYLIIHGRKTVTRQRAVQ